jgi:O-acetylhomoserine/O-acetylserine sulfhydrylase-like pyridoxal-dependent enzyme
LKTNRKVETIAAQAGGGGGKTYGAVSVPIYTSAIYQYERFGKNRGLTWSSTAPPSSREGTTT